MTRCVVERSKFDAFSIPCVETRLENRGHVGLCEDENLPFCRCVLFKMIVGRGSSVFCSTQSCCCTVILAVADVFL